MEKEEDLGGIRITFCKCEEIEVVVSDIEILKNKEMLAPFICHDRIKVKV